MSEALVIAMGITVVTAIASVVAIMILVRLDKRSARLASVNTGRTREIRRRPEPLARQPSVTRNSRVGW